jgi:hypothetical protein
VGELSRKAACRLKAVVLRADGTWEECLVEDEWGLMDVFDCPKYPHRSCLSILTIHATQNVDGLLQDEMVIITGMMIGRKARDWEKFLREHNFLVSVLLRRSNRPLLADLVNL